MENIQFYFLNDNYYIDFPDDKLMKNKETDEAGEHKRPCFFALNDEINSNIKWLVPVSSQYEKYLIIVNKKLKKYGNCNTIVLGNLLGKRRAFLIQNMCPSTEKYLIPYMAKNNEPIHIGDSLADKIISNAKEVLNMWKMGINLIFPNVKKIYSQLDTEV